jgi:hypothetical protein
MDDDDNTWLYILLGAVIVYFIMRSKAPAVAAPAPLLALPPASSGGVTAANIAPPDLSSQAIAATAPTDASNADMGGDNFGVMSPGEW